MKKQLSEQESSEGLRMEASTSHSSVNNNNNNNSSSSNSYGTTAEGSPNYDSPPMTKSKFLVKVFRLLIFGLSIYLVDVALHLTIASHYLTMRHCHRSISHDLTDFKLDNFVNFSSFSSPPSARINDGDAAADLGLGGFTEATNNDNFLAEKLGTLLNGGLYLNLRDKVIKILPTHWVQRIIEIVSFQIGQHNFSQIPLLCTFNGIRFSSLPHMVTYVCDNAFSAGIAASIRSRNSTENVEQAIEAKKREIFNALDHLIPGKHTEKKAQYWPTPLKPV